MTLTLHSSQSISRTLVPSTYVSNVKDIFFCGYIKGIYTRLAWQHLQIQSYTCLKSQKEFHKGLGSHAGQDEISGNTSFVYLVEIELRCRMSITRYNCNKNSTMILHRQLVNMEIGTERHLGILSNNLCSKICCTH